MTHSISRYLRWSAHLSMGLPTGRSNDCLTHPDRNEVKGARSHHLPKDRRLRLSTRIVRQLLTIDIQTQYKRSIVTVKERLLI
ncbi:MAG: hypothetical protein QNJ46_10865 [Leptolyngbyaceae cyanobacterium MO_188.B28]|nr:hypothetical protein [Leptolyngbyaceae cyanobacterium MO_188.B28]